MGKVFVSGLRLFPNLPKRFGIPVRGKAKFQGHAIRMRPPLQDSCKVSVRPLLSFDPIQATAIPVSNPERWPSHDTAAEVGKTPRMIPPYVTMHTADKHTVAKLRLKYARELR